MFRSNSPALNLCKLVSYCTDMIQLGVHLHHSLLISLRRASCASLLSRGCGIFILYHTPDIIWLIKTKHVELQERKTICYIFANNAEIKTILCVCALAIICCFQSSTEGWKSKNQKGAKIRIGNQIIPIITCVVFIYVPFDQILAWWSVCDSIRLKNYMHPHVNII